MFELPKRDPSMDRRILDSIYPSDFFPVKGQYFRVRAATIADRSFMGDIWLCLGSQDHCAVGKKVLDTYMGLEGNSTFPLGTIRSFVAGDVIFYNCTEIWAAVEEDRGAPVIQPAQPEGESVES
jgi:hypothetical protein